MLNTSNLSSLFKKGDHKKSRSKSKKSKSKTPKSQRSIATLDSDQDGDLIQEGFPESLPSSLQESPLALTDGLANNTPDLTNGTPNGDKFRGRRGLMDEPDSPISPSLDPNPHTAFLPSFNSPKAPNFASRSSPDLTIQHSPTNTNSKLEISKRNRSNISINIINPQNLSTKDSLAPMFVPTSPLKSPTRSVSTSRVIQDLQNKIDKLRRESNHLKMQASEQKKTASTYSKRFESLTNELEMATKENEAMSIQFGEREDKISNLACEISTLDTKLSSIGSKEVELTTKCRSLEETLSKLNEESKMFEKAYEAALQGQTDLKIRYKNQLSNLNEKLNEFQLKREKDLLMIENFNKSLIEKESLQNEINELNLKLKNLSSQREEELLNLIKDMRNENINQKESMVPISKYCNVLLSDIERIKDKVNTMQAQKTMSEMVEELEKEDLSGDEAIVPGGLTNSKKRIIKKSNGIKRNPSLRK